MDKALRVVMNTLLIVSLLIAWADLIRSGCNVPSIKRLNFYDSIEILNGTSRTLSCEIHSDTALHKDLPFSGWKRDYPPYLPTNYSLGNASCSVTPSKICIDSNLTLINVIQGEYDGNYSLTVVNDCGNSTVYVYVDIIVLPKCRSDYSRPPPLKIPPPSVVQAVQGMSVIIKATYTGHYDDPNLLAFWCVVKQDSNYHCFLPTDNNTVYSVTTNGCLPPNFDCCYFIISIEIRSLTFDLSQANLTSMAGWNQRDPSYSVGNSTLIVNPYPTLDKTLPIANSQCIELNEGHSTEFTCIYNASTNQNVTITTWKFNEELLQQNSSHYTMITHYGNDPRNLKHVLSKLILSNLKPDHAGTYTCQCVYSSKVYVSGKDNIGSEAASFCVKVNSGKTLIIIGSVVGVVGLISLIFILMFCCCYWRRRRLKRLKKSESPQSSSEEEALLSASDYSRPLLSVLSTGKKIESEPDGLQRVASSGKAKNATTATATGDGNGDVTASATGTGKVTAEAIGTGNGTVTAIATGTGTVTAIARNLPSIENEQPKAKTKSKTTASKQSSVKPPTLNRFASDYPIDCEKDGEPSGGDKPTITQFNQYVDEIAPRWYDLGAELLQNCINHLAIIEANHSHDVRICCQKVFNKWIEEDSEASWNTLIDALIKIGLLVIAKRIKKDVTKVVMLDGGVAEDQNPVGGPGLLASAHKQSQNLQPNRSFQKKVEAFQDITDEMLDLYVMKELFTYWEKLGKALHLEEDLLQEIYDKFPEDPAERLRTILRKWWVTADKPSLDTLDVILKHFGLKSSIPDRRVVILNSGMVSTSCQIPVGGPGPLISISRHGRILPGMNSYQTEIRSFNGVLCNGFPPLTVLTCDLQEEWKVFGKHMGLPLLLLEQIKQKHACETTACCWAVCHHWLKCNIEATWNDLLNKLVSLPLQWNSIASGLNHYLKSLLANTDGQSKERKNSLLADTNSQSKDKKNMISILLNRFKEIIEHVNLEELVVQLATRCLLTVDEQYMLTNLAFSPQNRNKRLLIILQSKDPRTCVQLFYECLRAEEEHSGHKYLADLLESDIREFENQHQVTIRGPDISNAAANQYPVASGGPGISNAVAAVSGFSITESEIDRILPRLKSCWLQVAKMVLAPQEMLNNIITSTQDHEEQARRFFLQFAVYSKKESIYKALEQLGQ